MLSRNRQRARARYGGGGGFPSDGGPTLVLDFIGGVVPQGVTLDINFLTLAYQAYQPEAVAPSFTNFWVWN